MRGARDDGLDWGSGLTGGYRGPYMSRLSNKCKGVGLVSLRLQWVTVKDARSTVNFKVDNHRTPNA